MVDSDLGSCPVSSTGPWVLWRSGLREVWVEMLLIRALAMGPSGILVGAVFWALLWYMVNIVAN